MLDSSHTLSSTFYFCPPGLRYQAQPLLPFTTLMHLPPHTWTLGLKRQPDNPNSTRSHLYPLTPTHNVEPDAREGIQRLTLLIFGKASGSVAVLEEKYGTLWLAREFGPQDAASTTILAFASRHFDSIRACWLLTMGYPSFPRPSLTSVTWLLESTGCSLSLLLQIYLS